VNTGTAVCCPQASGWSGYSDCVAVNVVTVGGQQTWRNVEQYGGKGKYDEVVLVHSMKAYRGSRDIPPLIRHIGTK
jgi:hypothetical protein